MNEEKELAPNTTRSRWGKRRLLTITAGVLTLGLVAWLAVRDTSPVGHFTSAAGHDRFFDAYTRAMRDLPAPNATLDLRTDYGVVRVYRFDGADPTAPPLVLLPGRAAATPMWADNLPTLTKLRTVYAIDLLGEPGASIQTRPIEHDDDQARWLHQALRQLPEKQLYLLGVSIGGWTATNLAIRQPDKIAGVILLDPAMTFAGMPFRTIIRSIPASVRWSPKSWRDDFNSWTAGGAPVEDVPVADMIEAGMQTYALHLPAPTEFSDDQLKSLKMPILVLLAGRSVMHDSAAAARRAESVLADATVRVYPDASHAINGEYPDEIASATAAFLERAR
ncbi:alpha/beta fold hydrolase [Nocardia sp. CS682]|uniref:alpha/beta fold hydrolase n=1 Tax=Nocardia sp. CS682 TaxID=1047172 RepID=UPI00107506A7|nr:alpha/beta hydrolase [Nocardia sp. CS682]QBS39377.1 alpha/beta hydrolase [Nocardia sp. CS682]